MNAKQMAAEKVYERNRALKLKLRKSGKCQCCCKKKPKERIQYSECSPCANRHKEAIHEKRVEAAFRGDCSNCRSRPSKEGRRLCQYCLDGKRERYYANKDRTGATVRCEGLGWELPSDSAWGDARRIA